MLPVSLTFNISIVHLFLFHLDPKKRHTKENKMNNFLIKEQISCTRTT